MRGIAHHQRSYRSHARRAVLAMSRGQRSTPQLICQPSRQGSTQVVRSVRRSRSEDVGRDRRVLQIALQHHLRCARHQEVGRVHLRHRVRSESAPCDQAIVPLRIRRAALRRSPKRCQHLGVRRALRLPPQRSLPGVDRAGQHVPHRDLRALPRCRRVRVTEWRQRARS